MTRPKTLATAALIALAGAGCSSGSPAGDHVPATHEQALKFARCMRQNGVTQFPDPDASGAFTIDEVVNGSSLHPDSPAWKAAMAACKDLQPAGFTGRRRSPEQQAAALRFAQCIRANGVKDFPDPASGEPLVDTNRIPSSAEPGGMNTLRAAMRMCSGAAAGAGVSRP